MGASPVSLPPGFTEDPPQPAPTGGGLPPGFTEDHVETIGEAVKSAVRDMFKKPAVAAADLATNPRTMANALPAVAGAAGAVSPIPGGATMGTVGGRQISNAVLKGLGHPEDIPSPMNQVLEGGLAAAGDVLPIPAIKAKVFGNQIGDAEKAAGVITSAADKYPTSGSVGEFLNTLESQIDNGTLTDPNTIKKAKDAVDFIHQNPNIVGKSNAINVQSARVASKVSGLINDPNIIPGRAAPSAAFANSQVIPDALRKVWDVIPPKARAAILTGLGIGGGVGAGNAIFGGSKR